MPSKSLRLIRASFLILPIGLNVGAAQATNVPTLAPAAVAQFYQASVTKSIWDDDKNFADLLQALKGLRLHGLNPTHYHYDDLAALKNKPAQREKLATDAWFSAASHMIYGKLDPQTIEPDWTAARRKANLAAHLQKALNDNTIANSLDALAPKQPGYESLQAELVKLLAISTDAPTIIPNGPTMRVGDQGPRVALLHQRLKELGALPRRPATPTHFDMVTEAAVKEFQATAGLMADGLVGPASAAALNRSVETKIRQVRVNLERWRWLPDTMGRRHIRANIADFNLTTWQDGAPVRTHRTIVGQAYRKTPVFSGSIQYIVFNPWWETPDSLARKDKLPAFRADPAAVKRLGFEVRDRAGNKVNSDTIDWNAVSATNFPYRLRQAPGPLNALGRVKIIFPNIHNVYIHDTPGRDLFTRPQRALSSGCLRTEAPLELAAWLLAETPTWPATAQTAALESGQETRAPLSAQVPVHVLYLTVVPETDGTVRYLDDVYDRDAAVLDGLRTTPN